MEVKDLMIGDLVYRTDFNTPVPSKIIGIEIVNYDKMEYIVDVFNKNGYNVQLYLNEIEPIPLTSKILEKNGFTLKEGEKGMYGVTIAPYYTCDDVPFEVFCDGEPFAIWFKDPVNIKYVHELQHALRLCGIEKEIIL